MALAAISSALSALKSIKDLAETMITLRDAQALQANRLELQGKIIDAQAHIFAVNEERTALIEQIADLKEQVAEMADWRSEKQKYQLAELAPGVFAYRRKPAVDDTTPSHELCASCYEQGKKSILQSETRAPGRVYVLVCQSCSAELYVEGMRQPEHGRRRR